MKSNAAINVLNGRYIKTDDEFSVEDNNNANRTKIFTISRCKSEIEVNGAGDAEKEYSYKEAIELAGNGKYTLGLLATLSLSIVAMTVDMFSFSTIVALSSCDFHLTHEQTHLLLSVPFVGPITMAYGWGYISDTQGRRRSLIVAMAVSFVMSVLSMFAPNWIVLAVFKFVGTCFCSCAQSVAYTLLGESCSERLKGTYLLIMTSIMQMSLVFYFVVAYIIGFVDFSYDLKFITFVPWRLFIFILATPLGLAAILLMFFYESPKFLLNAGKEDQALDILKKICRRNCGTNYPVKKVILQEEGNLTHKSETLLVSLWQQTAPLFKPPLLSKTVLLYCLIFIIYSTTSCLSVWLPFLANDFTNAIASSDHNEGLCNLISNNKDKASGDEVECTARIELPIVIFSASEGLTYAMLNFFMSKLASRKKTLIIIIFVVSSACAIGALNIPNNLTNIILFFGILCNGLGLGIVFTYCVEFYPTSFRGMASCLGVMVARMSGLFGVNFIGSYINWQCERAFYGLTAIIFSGAVLSCFLPSDRVKKNLP